MVKNVVSNIHLGREGNSCGAVGEKVPDKVCRAGDEVGIEAGVLNCCEGNKRQGGAIGGYD